MHIGNKIKEEVAKRNISVTDFAKLINKSRPYTYSIFEKENIKSKMLLQVHDELIFNVYDDEIDKVKEIVYNTMTNVFDLKVPLDVDIELGNNWYEAK